MADCDAIAQLLTTGRPVVITRDVFVAQLLPSHVLIINVYQHQMEYLGRILLSSLTEKITPALYEAFLNDDVVEVCRVDHTSLDHLDSFRVSLLDPAYSDKITAYFDQVVRSVPQRE